MLLSRGVGIILFMGGGGGGGEGGAKFSILSTLFKLTNEHMKYTRS